ncbi:gamma carbonic anhydrase family protein [Acinetobacter gyllenbergii]|uniref:gamma carbonic anhydrase family protein n=1 Tax=Acinetobacter gyllenbergii TaxID=134534 RepID=UPI000806A498|nr:gamma carbonic anhydrase family protein [Acinetobacter gyllenbergii]OBY73084.1 carbonic anhydrase [Acinetobacter gyllenbergii]
MPCYSIDGVIPVVHPSAFVHPTAVLIGDVIIEAGVYIGPFASLRADFGRIQIKQNANVQDNCIIHGFPQSITLIEEMGHIGHAATLHGCRIGKNVLIGMNSVILDYAEIGENTIIGANSLVKTKDQIPANVLAMGSPAKVVRDLTEQEREWKIKGTQEYIHLAQRCLNSMTEVLPLVENSPERKTYQDFQSDHQIKPTTA